jgi:glucose-1-phosphate adenylyltransferase
MSRAFAIVNSYGRHTDVKGMQDYRPVSAFMFCGRYRLIDFALSNLSNSGIDRIQVYVGQNPRSLAEHLADGRIYNLNAKRGKLQLLFNQDSNENDIYNTDVAAYRANLDIIERAKQPYVIITPGYMVFRQNFEDFLQAHIDSGADITLLYHKVNNAKEHYRNMNILNLNRQKGVKSIENNKGTADERNISMSTLVMSKDLFISLINKAAKTSSVYRLIDIINDELENLDVRGYQHKGHFAAVYDFRSYYGANMELLDVDEAKELFSDDWPFYTQTTDAAPVHYFPGGKAHHSMIANGTHVEGVIENSIIGRDVTIMKGAYIKNSIILGHDLIGENAHIENQVIDKWVKIIHAKEIVAPDDDPGYIRREDML